MKILFTIPLLFLMLGCTSVVHTVTGFAPRFVTCEQEHKRFDRVLANRYDKDVEEILYMPYANFKQARIVIGNDTDLAVRPVTFWIFGPDKKQIFCWASCYGPEFLDSAIQLFPLPVFYSVGSTYNLQNSMAPLGSLYGNKDQIAEDAIDFDGYVAVIWMNETFDRYTRIYFNRLVKGIKKKGVPIKYIYVNINPLAAEVNAKEKPNSH